ncbi:hypothetical protein BS333_06915 [Vibrio azureus]|nr:hypothetical protein BS333_06915 [Vibrio azureus]
MLCIFSVEAEDYYRIKSGGYNGPAAFECSGLRVGSIIPSTYSVDLGNKQVGRRTCKSATLNMGEVTVRFLNHRGKDYVGKLYTTKLEPCPSGTKRNPESGQCEELPESYCERPEVLEEMQRFRDSCAAKGNGYTAEISCSDATSSLTTYCAPPPDACLPGTPNWPACRGDDGQPCDSSSDDWNDRLGKCCNASNNFCDEAPPTPCTITSPDWPECDGDEPPNPDDSDNNDDGNETPNPDDGNSDNNDGSGGGNSGSGNNGSGNGSSGGGSSTPPPVEDNQDVNNSVKALNADMNRQLTSINNDMNRNHGESLTALEELKNSNKQAIDKYTTDVTNAINANGNQVTNALNANASSIRNAINGSTSAINGTTNAINNQTGKIEGGLTSVKDGLGELGQQVGDAITSLEGTNEQGFSDVIDAIKELGEGEIFLPEGDQPVNLLDDSTYNDLNQEITNLKGDIRSELQAIKDYFTFYKDLEDGAFNPHDLTLVWQTYYVKAENMVFRTLRDNAHIIAAVVLFMFGLAGIREILRAF